MTTPSRAPRIRPALTICVLMALTLAACGGDDQAVETSDSDVSACRSIALADASLAGTRESAQSIGATPDTVDDYATAISAVSASVVDPGVSEQIAESAVGLVSRWSRTRSFLSGEALNDLSFNPEAFVKRFDADALALEAVQRLCPGAVSDPESDD